MLDLNPIFMSSQNNNVTGIFLICLYKAGENIYKKEAAYISVKYLRHFDVCVTSEINHGPNFSNVGNRV